jgi:hypothetical protein
MPKVTIEFNLPEERPEYMMAVNAGEYYGALWEFYQYLRRLWKDGDMDSDTYKVVEEIWDRFCDEAGTLLHGS